MTQDARTKAGSCAVCKKCRIYIEGENVGRCIYGSPFLGYRALHAPGTWVDSDQPPVVVDDHNEVKDEQAP